MRNILDFPQQFTPPSTCRPRTRCRWPRARTGWRSWRCGCGCAIAPQRFFVTQQARQGERHVYASLSRFITDKAACFDRVSAQRPPGAEGAPGPDGVPDVKIDLAARVRDRWIGPS